jgi:hypothetical protein
MSSKKPEAKTTKKTVRSVPKAAKKVVPKKK